MAANVWMVIWPNQKINIASAESMGGNTAPNGDEVLRIVDDAIAIGAAEEAYRALANFLWNASGYHTVDEAVRVYTEGSTKLEGLPRPPAIGRLRHFVSAQR